MTVRRIILSPVLVLVALSLIAGIQVMSKPAEQATATPLPAQATAVPQTTTAEIAALESVGANSVVGVYFQASGIVQGIHGTKRSRTAI